jgi:tetratricopeptide (TPR) repeat protein
VYAGLVFSMSKVRLVFVAALSVHTCAFLTTTTPRTVYAAEPTNARAHARQAKAYFDHGDFAHAIEEYQAAYDLDHRPSRLYNLAVCYERSGARAKALELYQRYLSAEPDGDAAAAARESAAALAAEELEAQRQEHARQADEAQRQAEETAARERAQAAKDAEELRKLERPVPPPAPAASPAPDRSKDVARYRAQRVLVVEPDAEHRGRAPTFVLGSSNLPLEGSNFYRAVGRPDLATRYADRNAIRRLVLGSGGVLAGIGLGTVIFSALDACDAGQSDCEAAHGASNHRLMLWGLGMLVSGVAVEVAGALFEPDPVDPKGQRELVEAHNGGLRKQLGIQRDTATTAPAASLQVAPYAGPMGAGIALVGTF